MLTIYNLTAGINQGGVTMVSMKIGEDIITMGWVLDGYLNGATSLSLGATSTASLHIFNSSFGFVNVDYDYNMVEMIDFVNQNGVAFVASRGNFKYPVLSPNWLQTVSSPNIPATLKPKIIMNVGANGTNGEYHLDGVNGSQFTSPEVVDFVAPGDILNVKTTQAMPTNPIAPNSPNPSNYQTFSGTSASAPHVSGVAGLMMSYRNSNSPSWDNLVHEDCEYLMKRSATDLTITPTYTESIGPDVVTGYGRINAGAALVSLEPQFYIRHIDAAHYSTGTTQTSSLVAANVVRTWPGISNYFPYSGTYSVNIYKVTTIYSYSFPGETFLDKWPLYKASVGTPSVTFPFPIVEDEPHDVEVVNATISSATLVSYAYKLIQNTIPGSPVVNKYFPVDPANSSTFQVKSAFTLYTSGTPVNVKEKEAEVNYFNIYPNPNTGKFTVGFVSKTGSKGNLIVLDLMGKTIYEDHNINVSVGSNYHTLSLNNLPKGIYFLTLEIDNNKTMVKKLIID
ncbi:MAG TPA: S8/S53 family peptidase [Bacteroidia bacterium]|jgi:hypothetical protein|nr:S8/S53 family peptidase [Bacteroidia bacterium]